MLPVEYLPIVDSQGNQIGKATRTECHNSNGSQHLLHPVVHLQIINSQNQFYLQKRAMHKETEPGKWDCAVAGHVQFEETISEALERETSEELIYQNNVSREKIVPQFLSSYLITYPNEIELVYLFFARAEGPFQFDPLESTEGHFWSKSDIHSLIERGIFTPSFLREYKKHFIDFLDPK